MPTLKSNSSNGAFAADGVPDETWESFLAGFPGAPTPENALDRTLASLFDAPGACGRNRCEERAGITDAGEIDPLHLFQPNTLPAAGITRNGEAAQGASGEPTPAQRRAMLAALNTCISAMLARLAPERLPPVSVKNALFSMIVMRKRRAARCEAQNLRYRQAVEKLQNEAGALYGQVFLTAYLQEITGQPDASVNYPSTSLGDK